MRVTALCLFLIFAMSVSGGAMARCDCSSNGWISGCTATIKPDREGVLITSSSTQCSRVDWYLGGSPQVSVFWGGKEWESVARFSGQQSISVESCRVCKDEKANDAAARKPRQLFPDEGRGGAASASCDAFLARMAEIGKNVDVQNAEASMRAMTALCGSVEACMQRIQACSE